MFDQRVKARFPKGMHEADLIAELRKQGFSMRRDGVDCKSATKSRGVIIRAIWSVRWRAEADRVDEVWGVYGFVAP